MKIFLLTAIITFGLATNNFAQWGFTGGENIIQAGVGIGLSGANGEVIDDDFEEPWVFRLGYEYTLNNDVSLGGVLAYSTNSDYQYTYKQYYINNQYEYISSNESNEYTYYIVAFRLNYHFYSDEFWDFYCGATLGGNYVENTGYYYYYDSRDPFTSDTYRNINDSEVKLYYGAHLGMQVFFTPYFGMFLEGGYDLGLIAAGLTLKFEGY